MIATQSLTQGKNTSNKGISLQNNLGDNSAIMTFIYALDKWYKNI